MINFTETIIIHHQNSAECQTSAKVIERQTLSEQSTATLAEKSCFLIPPDQIVKTGDIITFNQKNYRIALLCPCRDISGKVRAWRAAALPM